jgi:hypothetical protein
MPINQAPASAHELAKENKMIKITATYQTILTNGFSQQIGNNSAANGGVCHVQLRKVKGIFHKRLINSNGRNQAVGKSEEIADIHALDLIRSAEERAQNDRKNGR